MSNAPKYYVKKAIFHVKSAFFAHFSTKKNTARNFMKIKIQKKISKNSSQNECVVIYIRLGGGGYAFGGIIAKPAIFRGFHRIL